jgi:hypothetical protein
MPYRKLWIFTKLVRGKKKAAQTGWAAIEEVDRSTSPAGENPKSD